MAKISGEALGAARDALAPAALGAQVELDLSDSEAHLGLPDAGEIYAIAEERGQGLADAVAEHRRRAGKGGRKPGARNRRTDDLARYLGQFGPDPAVALVRTLARPVELLAAELGCKISEAYSHQLRAADILMPYFHSKKPVEVKATGGAAIYLMAGMPGLDGALAGAGGATIEAGAAPVEELAFHVVPTEQNQPLSDDDAAVSE